MFVDFYVESHGPEKEQLGLANGIPHVVVFAVAVERFSLTVEGAVNDIDQVSDFELVWLLQLARKIETSRCN